MPGDARARLVGRFGVAAEAWCDALPGLVLALTRAWRLRSNTVLPGGANSVVLSCVSIDDEAFVLKVTPDLTVAAEEGGVERLGGVPACGLARRFRSRPGCAAAGVHSAQGQVVRRSWRLVFRRCHTDAGRAVAAASCRIELRAAGAPELKDRIELVFDLAQRRLQRSPAVNARIGRAVVERSHALARELAVGGPAGLVHGDLHPGNVLRAGDHGVVAIDPRPCWGDHAIDAVDCMLSGVVDEPGLERRIDWLTRTSPRSTRRACARGARRSP